MKRNVKSVLAICLVAALLFPTVGLKNNRKTNSRPHGTTTFISVDPDSER